jgi:hypothetical protein
LAALAAADIAEIDLLVDGALDRLELRKLELRAGQLDLGLGLAELGFSGVGLAVGGYRISSLASRAASAAALGFAKEARRLPTGSRRQVPSPQR